MLIDFRRAEVPTEIETDLCIIGAGAAGITLARSMIAKRLQVCVVESGGLELEPDTQSLYDGEAVGLPWGTELSSSRLRYFGGTTNHWGGGCIPLEQLDFSKRAWVPYSGWPIRLDELELYYARARSICQLDQRPFGKAGQSASRSELLSRLANLANVYGLSSPPTRFGTVYRSELDAAANIRVLLYANLLELDPAQTGCTVRQARIRTLEGRTGAVRARCFVLACGGIENARLLLLSNSVVPGGLGNRHDLVGRFFMDHPSGRLGTLTTQQPELLALWKRAMDDGEVTFTPDIGLSADAQERECLLGARFRLLDREDQVPDGIRAVRQLRAGLTTGSFADGLSDTVLRILSDLGDVASGTGRSLVGEPVVPTHHMDCNGYFEQAPNPDSRVQLGDHVDALGQRVVRLDWRLTDLDRRSYRAAIGLFGAEFGRAGLGRLQLDPWLRPSGDGISGLGGACHHLGTTRMSHDPETGVVDRDCRVHGIDNLYIAGSSVFPTAGFTYPTFTIVALALRLAEHLSSTLS